MLELNATRSTLDKAKRHLVIMNEAFQNDVIFSDNLNDFFSTARNVTFHMQKQYSGKEGFGKMVPGKKVDGKKIDDKWDGWYGSKVDEMNLLHDLKFSNKARICSVHREPIPHGATRAKFYRLDAILVGEGSKPDILESEISEALPTLEPPEPKTLYRWFCEVGRYFVQGEEFEKKDVIETCESIIEYLDKLVDECEAKFS